MTDAIQDLCNQWRNPTGFLALLLLVSGEVVQKAIAQTFGFHVDPFGIRLYLTPVAFSFGWVGYAFLSFNSAIGRGRLIPEPDGNSIVVNCDNGFVRNNRSWVLARLLRDSERCVRGPPSKGPENLDGTDWPVSLWIDIFIATEVDHKKGPRLSRRFLVCWLIIILQLGIAAVPWIMPGKDWTIFLITASGTLFSLISGSFSEWEIEKWSSYLMKGHKKKIIALTRGNGHRYVMLIIGHANTWDFEAWATARSSPQGPSWILAGLMLGLWILLLLTVAGITHNSWYLVGIGTIGMFQNSYLAGAPVHPTAADIYLKPWKSPHIIGYKNVAATKAMMEQIGSAGSSEKPKADRRDEKEVIRDVMGALQKLETKLPGTGLSLLPVFFPGSIEYSESRLKFQEDKEFWKEAYTKQNDLVIRTSKRNRHS